MEQVMLAFPFSCREYVEQHSEISPICIYMRDEVSQQTLFSSIPLHLPLKITRYALNGFPAWKMCFFSGLTEEGKWKSFGLFKAWCVCVLGGKNPLCWNIITGRSAPASEPIKHSQWPVCVFFQVLLKLKSHNSGFILINICFFHVLIFAAFMFLFNFYVSILEFVPPLPHT